MLTASFGVLSQNTGFYPSLDRIVETTLGPLNLGPGGGCYNEPISRLQRKGAQGGAQAVKGQVGKKTGLGRSAQVPRSWNLGKLVWWAHRKGSKHRVIGATRAGLW